jgi:hypothetical protein
VTEETPIPAQSVQVAHQTSGDITPDARQVRIANALFHPREHGQRLRHAGVVTMENAPDRPVVDPVARRWLAGIRVDRRGDRTRSPRCRW